MSGSRWADMTRISKRDAGLVEHLAGLLHLGHVGLRAHDDPDARRVDLELVERGLGLGLGERPAAGRSCGALLGAQGDVAAQLPAVEGDQRRRQHRRRARAAAGVSPSAVTFEHAPAGGHEVAPSASAVPACVTSTPAGDARRAR